MTKEELEKYAEEYAKNLAFVFETDIVQRIVRERVRLALIDVLESREKRIAHLEATNKRIAIECHKLCDTLEKKQNEIAELKKACDETQTLLDKQIEATYKLDKENAELKRDKEDLLFIRDQSAKCMCEDKERLTYAKTIIQDLLENTDEYARQRAIDFLKENK